MKNYYKILEVDESASKEVIDKAYKVLVKKYHPDLTGKNYNRDEKIKEINEAYNVLSNSFLKEQYDKELYANTQNNQFQEHDYSRLYREKEKLKYQLEQEKHKKTNTKKSQDNNEEETPQVGTGNSILNIFKTLFKHRPTMETIKNIKRIDIIALILTIIVVLLIGTILYFLPFTHDWMVRNFIDTPLVNWIKGIFN